ncbi:hypothetical protein LXA43DRAFT_1096383 [Ganoderma leucocontextum]|nr:hypothetical protein LXA43DRAFT_1096383 [Ganoderma leucocontextum]
MSTIALEHLLAFLELNRADGNPVDNPSPWDWQKWQQFMIAVAPRSRPPWRPDATLERTGLFDLDRAHCKDFIVAYHAAGTTPLSRRQFAISLDEGEVYKGLLHLLRWWSGFMPLVEREADRILAGAEMITRGPNTIQQIDIQNPRMVILTLAGGFLGDRAYQGATRLRPEAQAWLEHMLRTFRERWQCIYDNRMRFIDQMPRMMYAACQGLSSSRCRVFDIDRYLHVLEEILQWLVFEVGENRTAQREHYRKLLNTIQDSLGTWNFSRKRASVCLPPHMTRALDSIGSEADLAPIRAALARCSNTLEANTSHDHLDEFDAFALLCEIKVISLVDWQLLVAEDACPEDPRSRVEAVDFAGLEGDLRLTETLTAEWDDEDKAAFLFTVSSLPRNR